MKTTYFEIIENKNYRSLTAEEKDAIQNRQTDLAVLWQDATTDIEKEVIFDELHASLTGLIKGMSYRQAEKSFTVEQEDFEGIMHLILVETLSDSHEGQTEMYGQKLLSYDRESNKPFQPIFITNVKNALKMMYRQKGYDVHETTYHETNRLDSPAPEDNSVTMLDALDLSNDEDFANEFVVSAFVEDVLTKLFGTNEIKKTIVKMYIEGFKRNEIVSAVNVEGKSTDAMVKQVNRTWKEFKLTYAELV